MSELLIVNKKSTKLTLTKSALNLCKGLGYNVLPFESEMLETDDSD